MKKVLLFLLVAIMALGLFACGKKAKVIEPLYTEVDMKNLPDGIYPVTFKREDVKTDNSELTIKCEVFSEDLWDTVEIHQMQVGDYFVQSGKKVKIEKLFWDEQQSKCCINFDSLEDAIEIITPSESGGTYYIQGLDDHHTYTKRGETTLKVDKNCLLTDASDLESAPNILKYDEIEKYVKNQEYDNFWYLNTNVRVENGVIVDINKWYIP